MFVYLPSASLLFRYVHFFVSHIFLCLFRHFTSSRDFLMLREFWSVGSTYSCLFLVFFLRWGDTCVRLVRRPLIGLLYQPWMINDEYGVVGIMRIGRGNRSTRRKSATAPLYFTQMPHDLTWGRIRAASWEASDYSLELWHGLQLFYWLLRLDVHSFIHIFSQSFWCSSG
jgi:hypothetical protein